MARAETPAAWLNLRGMRESQDSICSMFAQGRGLVHRVAHYFTRLRLSAFADA